MNLRLYILEADPYYCYILQSISNPRRTYIGITNNLKRRLRQHNGDIVGGAKYTRSNRPWQMIGYLGGFRNKNEVLRFEYRMHHPPKGKYRQKEFKGKKRIGLNGRVSTLREVILQGSWILEWQKGIGCSTRPILRMQWLIPDYTLNLNYFTEYPCFEICLKS